MASIILEPSSNPGALVAAIKRASQTNPLLLKPGTHLTSPGIGEAIQIPIGASGLRIGIAPGVPTTPSPSPANVESSSFSSSKIPNAHITDQNGQQLNFYNDLVKGKTVAINFIFTTCTASCPPLTATFRRVQQNAEQRGLPLQLISISVDPTVDTPERLHAFAEKFNAGPGWTFVTGDKSEIDSLLERLGVAVANKNDHTPMIMIGNDVADYWTRAYGLSAPTKLVELIADAAGRK